MYVDPDSDRLFQNDLHRPDRELVTIGVDAHCHLQFKNYDEDRDIVIRRAKEAGVGFIVCVGTTVADSKAAVALAEQYPGFMRASVGVHPTELSDAPQFDAVRELARKDSVAAIGECGLDYFSAEGRALKAEQRDLFLAHMALARDVGKPLMIHCRPSPRSMDAYEDLYGILEKEKNRPPFVMHFFAGSVALAERFIALGAYFTFGGAVTLTHDYDEAVRRVPPERLMTETDAPFVSPVSIRGRRNEPANVVDIARQIAHLKGMAPEELAEHVWKNSTILRR